MTLIHVLFNFKVCSEVNNICLKENGSSTIQILFKSLPNSPVFQEKKYKVIIKVFE